MGANRSCRQTRDARPGVHEKETLWADWEVHGRRARLHRTRQAVTAQLLQPFDVAEIPRATGRTFVGDEGLPADEIHIDIVDPMTQAIRPRSRECQTREFREQIDPSRGHAESGTRPLERRNRVRTTARRAHQNPAVPARPWRRSPVWRRSRYRGRQSLWDGRAEQGRVRQQRETAPQRRTTRVTRSTKSGFIRPLSPHPPQVFGQAAPRGRGAGQAGSPASMRDRGGRPLPPTRNVSPKSERTAPLRACPSRHYPPRRTRYAHERSSTASDSTCAVLGNRSKASRWARW